MDVLTAAVAAVLLATQQDLMNSPIEPVSQTPETVRSLLNAGEPAVAYEILCDNLYEDDISVPRHLLQQLQQAVGDVGVDPSRVAMLLD